MQPSPSEGLKPLRKMRALSGFNTWHAEYLQSAESKTLPTLAAKNKKSAELWRELSSDQQTMYKERAAAVNVGITGINTKNESKKIYSLLQDVSEHANVVPGFHLMFVAVHNGKHVVGGSEIGGKFLQESGSHIPYSFLGYLSATKSSSCNSNLLSASSDHKPSKEDHDSKESLRRAVENLFNLRYGQSIGDTAARLPYRKIKEFGISMDGLPEDKSLKHPSSYGRLTLKEILANKDNITVTVSNHPSIQHHQERLATGSTDSSRMDTNVTTQGQEATYTVPELLTRTSEGANLNDNMDHPYSKPFPAGVGNKVQLLVDSKSVGIGTIRGGNELDGHHIPPEFVAVSIDEIDDKICPMFTTTFDKPFLYIGQFTAWPFAQLRCLQA